MRDTVQEDASADAARRQDSATGTFPAPARPRSAAGPQRPYRGLPDRILVAAHQACDLGELDVAGSLLSILELVLLQSAPASLVAHRRTIEGMVAAYERLWHLRRNDPPKG